MRLNLGCGDTPLAGWHNVDIYPGPGVDQVVDLNQHWPWPDNTADEARSWHTFEHLVSRAYTMNQLWRVLKPGAVAEIQVPTVDGVAAFSSPTHVSYWHRQTFWHFEAGMIHRERWGARDGVVARFTTLREHYDELPDTVNLTIWLQAVK